MNYKILYDYVLKFVIDSKNIVYFVSEAFDVPYFTNNINHARIFCSKTSADLMCESLYRLYGINCEIVRL